MKRMLWLGIGLAVGALVVRAATKRARAFTPQGIAGAVTGSAENALGAVRSFVDDVRAGMAERQDEIHAAIAAGIVLPADPVDDDEPYEEGQR
ncbi:hypothetical protein GCM10010123_14990 [Pilimelia anulata]|uniref:Secreted protein n=1 Tax=Pilimelia anulata TaxID=53371 RepID=A0A8J3B178_9ACTN|nr:hypothetical protein [Pilimelia anulata]GGJ86402.1 hypothetical protein GCM10010123_14990 [Pilimelia anulata]